MSDFQLSARLSALPSFQPLNARLPLFELLGSGPECPLDHHYPQFHLRQHQRFLAHHCWIRWGGLSVIDGRPCRLDLSAYMYD